MLTASDSESLCHRFSPTKEEILRCLLRPAINGELLASAVVIEADIYGENKEPWNIFDKAAQNSFWIFTRLKKKSKSRFDRTAGCGCWLGRSNKEIKNAHGQLIGFDKYFTFTCKKDQSSQRNGHWIMHEYSLSDKGLADYVICEIKNKDSAVAVGLNQQEDEDTKNKKRKTLDVVDEDMSVPSLKKVCADGLNATTTPTIDQQNSEELDHWQTMNNISPPEDNYGFVNWVDEVSTSIDPSVPALSTYIDQSQGSFCIYQELINCNTASTRNDQSTNSGELDHWQTMTNISPPENNNGFVNWVDEVLTSNDPSVPALSTDIDQSQGSFFISQELINCNTASTRNDQSINSGELDHRQTTHEDTEAYQQDTDGFADWLNGVLPSNF